MDALLEWQDGITITSLSSMCVTILVGESFGESPFWRVIIQFEVLLEQAG
jgi:hypothetical protein